MTVNHPVAGSSPANTAPFGDMIVDVIIEDYSGRGFDSL